MHPKRHIAAHISPNLVLLRGPPDNSGPSTDPHADSVTNGLG